MRRTSLVIACYTICISLLVTKSFAEDSTLKSSSPVEVVYIVTGSTIQTYDVAASTGIPTPEGPPLTLPANAPYVTPSPNGHFLYVQGSYDLFRLWVYATSSTGVPEFPAIQSLPLPRALGMLRFDPNGKFAYAVKSTVDSRGNTHAAMRLFDVDPVSGVLTEDPNAVATYPLNGPCVRHYSGSLQIAGFNPSGSHLYVSWSCSYPGDTGAVYSYTQKVNRLTGALESAVPILKSDESDSSENRVSYTPKSLFDFSVNLVGPPGSNSLDVYRLSGGPKPILTCTASMLEACGYALSAIPDLSGNFVFLNLSDSDTQIAQVDLTTKNITDSGYSVLGSVQYFSPDDVLVYSEVSDACTTSCSIYIYNFDHSSGAVTTQQGSVINTQTYPSSVIPALRE
jgi:hypothetical protein